MAEQPTIGELFKAKEVTSDDLQAIAAGWLRDRAEGALPIGGYKVEVTAAIAAHPPARDGMDEDGSTEAWKLTLIRTAIILARAEAG